MTDWEKMISWAEAEQKEQKVRAVAVGCNRSQANPAANYVAHCRWEMWGDRDTGERYGHGQTFAEATADCWRHMVECGLAEEEVTV